MSCKAFLDSNILFSATLSSKGASRKILHLSAERAIHTVISQQVVDEVERNLSRKYPELLDLFPSLLQEAQVDIEDDPSQEEIRRVLPYLPFPPDAALLAAAQKSQADYFVTGDKEHFLSKPELKEHAGLRILSPRAFLEALSKEEERF